MVKAVQLLALSLNSFSFRGFATSSSSTSLRPIAATNRSAFNHHLHITRASSTYTQSKASTDQILLSSFTSLEITVYSILLDLNAEINRWSWSIMRSDPIKFTTRKCSITPISPTPWSTSVRFFLVNHTHLYIYECMYVYLCVHLYSGMNTTHANWGFFCLVVNVLGF